MDIDLVSTVGQTLSWAWGRPSGDPNQTQPDGRLSQHMLSFPSLYSLQAFTLLRVALPAQPQISILWAWAREGTNCLPQKQEICLHNPGGKEPGHSPAQLMTQDMFGPYKILVYLLIPISG